MVFYIKDIKSRQIAFTGEDIEFNRYTGESIDEDTDVVTPTYIRLTSKSTIEFVSEKTLKLIPSGYQIGVDIVVNVSTGTGIDIGSYFTWNSKVYVVSSTNPSYIRGEIKEQRLICRPEQ